ncbi:MAG: hypothetical protein IJ352_01880 [Muribaculaceae bacterium]|nr:hypothetical protein [Muribaculaceae bacterium]
MDNRCVRKGAISLDEVLNDIEVPSLEAPDLDTSFVCDKSKDLFAEKKRAAWKDVQQTEARCDFAPNKVRISYRNPQFGIISLWKKSVYGRTLTDIKADPDMVEFFAVNVAKLVGQILGSSLSLGDWAIVTSPKRRHKERNFASLVSARLADLLGIPFYEDIAECHSKHRVGAVFTFGAEPPKERNIIVFDDFVTTGATMISMRELLLPLGKNLVFFTGINNKL